MSRPKPDPEEREQRILNTAVDLILRQGYDKTTLGDIADETGISRGVIYQHFKNKEELFDKLILRESQGYFQAWVDYIETDPQGGTMGSIYRAVVFAINSQPFMAAMMRRDRRVMGSYLRKPNNLFAELQSSSIWVNVLQAMQEAGVVRRDVDVRVAAYILDIFSFGLVSMADFQPLADLPPVETTLEAMAEMIDRYLAPEDGGNRAAGKAIIREITLCMRSQFVRVRPTAER